MEKFEITERNKVKRVPNRGHYDQDTLYAILDDAKVCHVAFTMEGQPYVIPMIFGRKGDMIFLHGATSSRLMKNLAKGIRVCVG
ncbi:MAG: pyridoxamine 5'-phosphate oxidase family protein, partial [Aliifodinibius sp.]|nr:pyridoxamine 5'-phosphate oxidase family protein [Fodinibius sp.]NIV11221.1 pyridoxamine 5'-phosphate oxidase family protein [Fodinibius sp.]NIY24818.1 pyridoxamine 5'-phosphate oxidase family protein [Fodinibius sp.]